MQYRHCSVQTPETSTSTHYWFTHAANFKTETSEAIDVVFDGVSRAFKEDKDIIEVQQKALQSGRPFQPMNIAHDQALVLARRLIQRMLDEEAQPNEQKPAPAAFELAQ
jgi:phenylpropionate dioxygenase-like ring-hydroxylating dioxygenase large terminal subunit